VVVEHSQPGVAVGRRFHHPTCADAAGGAGPIFDNDRLFEALLKRHLDEPLDGIGRAARRIGHDHAQRAGRPGLGSRKQRRSQGQADSAHDKSPPGDFHVVACRKFIMTGSIQLLRARRTATLGV
jgi:hypothetical protein